MPAFRAPLSDIRFVLTELLDATEIASLPGYEDATPDVLLAVLEEGAKVCEEVLFPLNQPGDAEGCTLADGVVHTPTGFKDAWELYRQGGWMGLGADPAYGGQGLPHILAVAMDEMLSASNQSFSMYPGLTAAAYGGIHAWGSDELKQRYLPKLVSGEWAGTMCLTEAHAGTDLGIITSRAVPAGDGAYHVTGTKIFISAGEHDLAENIIHLVLARLPGAPEGTRGISMFLIPKFIPTEDGRPGTRNAVRCGAIEHKMGIRGSVTCVLDFENAVGWLVGEEHRGMRAMFTLMNAARLGVGMQGLGLAEVSYQNAVAYAKDRLQGRALTGTTNRAGPADPIIVHPDVRRMLMQMRAFIEGSRALAYWVGLLLDVSHRHPDAERRQEADDLVAFLTPVVKAFLTDYGFDAANLGLQVYGGHGYIREHGMEQYVRDARIGQIYEGTNGVQAMDLVGRKLLETKGALFARFAREVEATLTDAEREPRLASMHDPLAETFAELRSVSMSLAEHAGKDAAEIGAAANDYLHLVGLVAVGLMWLRAARVALARLDAGADDRAFYEAKLATGRFYFARIFPRAGAHLAAIRSGAESVMALGADQF